MRYFSLIIMLAALWFTTATNSHFSQDSWSYYELSRHIFNDFYHINSWRQFHIISAYGVSFPPLWPLLIATANTAFHLGIYAGFVLNFIIVTLTFMLLLRMSKIWLGEKEIGNFLFFALMITPDYTTAVFSAGTLPLSLLLLLVILYLYAARRYTPLMKALLIGIVSGLSVLNRFDFLLPALVLGFFIRPFLLYYLVLLVTLLPWVAYSYTHFGVWWITDNSRTILSSIPLFVRDYYPNAVPLIWDNPSGWMKKTMAAIIKSADVLFTTTSALPWLLGLTLLITKRPEKNKNLTLFAVLVVAQVISVLLTGFVETRYYVPLQLFLLVGLLFLTLSVKIKPIIIRTMPLIFALLSIAFAGAYIAKSVAQAAPLGFAFNAINQQPEEFAPLLACMKNKPQSILLPPKNYSYKFGALTGVTSYIEPTNMSVKNASIFLKQFKPQYVLTSTPEIYGMQKSLCSFKGWGESDAVYQLYKF